MKMIKATTLPALVLATVLPVTVMAEWTGGVEGGTVVRDGESASRIRGYASLNERPLSHYLYIEWYRFNANSFEFGYEPRYWLDEKLYLFGDGRMRLDEDRVIEQQTNLVGGVGMQLIATEKTFVWIEAGAGYRLITYTEESGVENANEPVGSIRGGGQQILSDLFKLEGNFDVFSSSSYTDSQLEVGVSMRVAQGAIKVSQRLRRIDVDGFESTNDSDTGVAITVGF